MLSKPVAKEDLFLYLAISEHAVSTVLIREEDKMQWLIYYVSKALLDAETRYTDMEKLVLVLVLAMAAKKLRPYFQPHKVIVLTSYPLKRILEKPASGRLTIWTSELGEYGIEFRPRTAIKGQALVDFVAELAYPVKDQDAGNEKTKESRQQNQVINRRVKFETYT